MRVKISFGGGGFVPFNYNLYLAGVLYRAFRKANEELASSLHSSRTIKLFTFSDLKGGKSTKQGLVFNRGGYFFVSSPRDDVLRAAVEGLLEEGTLKIGSASFHLESMEVLKPPEFNGTPVKLRTLSPIKVSTMIDTSLGRKSWDLNPTEEKFYTNIRRNLLKKYELFYGRPPSNFDLDFSPPSFIKQRRIKIRNTFHRCYMMDFAVSGSKELLEMGYESGFGEKNSMGFGMVEVSR